MTSQPVGALNEKKRIEQEAADIPKYVHHNNVNDNDAIIIIIIRIQPMLSTCEKEKLPATLSLISRMLRKYETKLFETDKMWALKIKKIPFLKIHNTRM